MLSIALLPDGKASRNKRTMMTLGKIKPHVSTRTGVREQQVPWDDQNWTHLGPVRPDL